MPAPSLAHKLHISTDAACAGWVSEKAKYPRDWSGAAEIPGGDVSRAELPSFNRRSVPGMSDSTPFGTAEVGSDSIDCGKLGLRTLVIPPLIVPIDPELPTVDPVYWTAELRDRASSIIANGHIPPSSRVSQVPQPDSNYDKTYPGADSVEENFTKYSHLLDERWTRSSSKYFCGLNVDSHPSTPSPRLQFPIPQTASPSTPRTSLISPMSNAASLINHAAVTISPMSNVGSPTSPTRRVPSVGATASLEDGINVWRLQSSMLSSLDPKDTHSQGCLLRPTGNTTSFNDSIRYHWYSNNERRRTPIQTRNFGVKANHDYGPHLGANPIKSRTQVNELQALVHVVNNEWMQGLLPSSDLYMRCSSLSPRTLFAKGIETLKTWLCNKLERTFEEVFSFMHIAFAAAFILHHEDKSYCWDAFFQDTLQLQHALVDREGKCLFLTAVERWWWPPGKHSTYNSVRLS